MAGIDSGTIVDESEEKDMSLAIAKMTYKSLRKRGYRVIINRTEGLCVKRRQSGGPTGGRHRKDLVPTLRSCQ